MTVRDLMTTNAVSCRPEINLAALGALMWEHDCGLIPVVDDRETVTGVITDRDISIALSTRDKQPSKITAGEIMTMPAFVCSPDEAPAQGPASDHGPAVVERSRSFSAAIANEGSGLAIHLTKCRHRAAHDGWS